jgi:hypothetical protein
MKHGEHQLQGGHFFFFVIIDGNAAAIVDNRYDVVAMYDDVDVVTVPRKRFVD